MNPAMGGPCQGIRNSIPAMQHLGCSTDVVCMDASRDTFGINDPFVVHCVGPCRGPWAYCKTLLPWLRQHLSDYDAVIIHGLWLYHSYAVTKAMARLRRDAAQKVPRVFVMPHGMLDPWFQRDRSRRVKAWRNWLVWKSIEHRVIREADAVLFTCQRELELARQTFRPYRPQREINVGYGVPEPPTFDDSMRDAFRSACPGIGDRKYLLFLSRIHPKKGVDLLLKAYAQILTQSENPSPPAPLPAAGRGEPNLQGARLPALVIAGPLDSDYAAKMQALALQLGLTNVYFPGMLTGSAKWGAFYGCEAFVLPSHQENFGIAVVEALACGKPVLISDQVNICNEIEQDRAGLVSTDSLDGTTQLLTDFLSLAAEGREEMAANAKNCFQNRFAIETAARQFSQAIKSVIANP